MLNVPRLDSSTLAIIVVLFAFTSVYSKVSNSDQNLDMIAIQKNDQNDIVKFFGGNVIVKEGETCETVVVVAGNADIKGAIQSDLVVIGGNLKLSGSVGENVVVIGGKVLIDSTAQINGDLVTIGTGSTVDPYAFINGSRVVIAPWIGGLINQFKEYAHHCLFKGRFVAVSLPWTLGILGAVTLLMFLLAFLFPVLFTRCIDIAEYRILAALLTGILMPIAIGPILVALLVTIIGIPVIPVFLFFLQGVMLVGILALGASVGRQVVHLVYRQSVLPSMVNALIGVLLFTTVMVIPFVGGFFTIVLTTIGTGSGVFALFDIIKTGFSKKRLPIVEPEINRVQDNSTTFTKVSPADINHIEVQSASYSTTTMVPATFLQRAGAAIIDIIIVMFLYGVTFEHTATSFIHHDGGSFKMLLLLIYLTVMWSWKQTTVGGIVFKLKVYRMDNSKFTLGVAVVRALGLLLSIVPLGLGFLWIAWDEHKQGWHDKIAGTVVYRVSDKISLI